MCLTDILVLQIVNPKGEMKGSAITGPVGKEAAELWPVSLLSSMDIKYNLIIIIAYCEQFRRCYVESGECDITHEGNKRLLSLQGNGKDDGGFDSILTH